MAADTGTDVKTYTGKLTLNVFLTCLVAATGGLILGYDIGVSGGVTSMDPFLRNFFPSVHRKMIRDGDSGNQYCKFDSQLLTTFTSSLYLAALIASFFASTVTRVFGRRISMLFGGATFLVGAAVNGAAVNVAMLIIGRILLGIGVGFAGQRLAESYAIRPIEQLKSTLTLELYLQSVGIYLSEMAPARLRGMLNIGCQLMITIGILSANLVNYYTDRIEGGYGWRVSLALAAVPAAIFTVGAIYLPDTPNSLIERGQSDHAKRMLQRLRGTDDVDEEYEDIVAASVASKSVVHPWAKIMERKHRPQLVMAILIPFFQQLTGINVIMFYAPVLFKTIGFGNQASLASAVITGTVNVIATFVSIFTVDKLGRRFLFLQGGSQMFVCQVVIGILIAVKFGTSGAADLSKGYSDLIVAFICIYVSGFAWSWGPLAGLVPSEIFPLEIRSFGQSINLSVNMFMTFAIAQAFISMLCHLKFGLFFFFAFWVLVMTIFIFFFLPETKNIPIEKVAIVWKNHWFWGKIVSDGNVNGGPEMEKGQLKSVV